MNTFFINVVFTIITLYIGLKAYYYGIYEIKTEKNTFGGSIVIGLSIVSVLFSNITVWVY